MTQTTADRIFGLIGEIRLWESEHDATDRRGAAEKIAAEIDALTAQLAEARAQIAALTPDAEAWRYKQACQAWDEGRITPFEFAEAHKLYSPQARRAREVGK